MAPSLSQLTGVPDRAGAAHACLHCRTCAVSAALHVIVQSKPLEARSLICRIGMMLHPMLCLHGCVYVCARGEHHPGL